MYRVQYCIAKLYIQYGTVGVLPLGSNNLTQLKSVMSSQNGLIFGSLTKLISDISKPITDELISKLMNKEHAVN